jgi:hypothetical protein
MEILRFLNLFLLSYSGIADLVGQVEKLKAMGIRTKKELPPTFAKELEEPLPESEQTNLPLTE